MRAMAIVYLLYGHDGRLVGEHTAETHLAFGEEIVHESERYLVVAVSPRPGETFVDPLFDGYALAGGKKP